MISYAFLITLVSIANLVNALALPRPVQKEKSDSLSFVIIGDYGYAGTNVQEHVAEQMEVWAKRHDASLIISVGDNFYSPDGVLNITDPNWRTHWKDIYRSPSSTPYLSTLPWHAILGNHDYCRNATAQIAYKSSGWRMDDFFWRYETPIGNTPKKASFVYLDTNMLAYGKDTLPWLLKDCPHMKQQFYDFGWDVDTLLQSAEMTLAGARESDWVLVFGHHPVGGSFCGAEGELNKIKELVERPENHVSAYVNGHVHALDYGVKEGIVHVTSGAGGNHGVGCKGDGGTWARENVGGFVGVVLGEEEMRVEFVDEWGQVLEVVTHGRR